MDILTIAAHCSYEYHKGETFKFVEGEYHEHPKAVADMVTTLDEKILAYLHDVIENNVVKRCGKEPDAATEEKCIAEIFGELRAYFKERGASIDHLLTDLDMLTRRRHQPDYLAYIDQLIDYAVANNRFEVLTVKSADLKVNKDPERNPVFEKQTEKDRERLRLYDIAEARIQTALRKFLDAADSFLDMTDYPAYAHQPQPRREGHAFVVAQG